MFSLRALRSTDPSTHAPPRHASRRHRPRVLRRVHRPLILAASTLQQVTSAPRVAPGIAGGIDRSDKNVVLQKVSWGGTRPWTPRGGEVEWLRCVGSWAGIVTDEPSWKLKKSKLLQSSLFASGKLVLQGLFNVLSDKN